MAEQQAEQQAAQLQGECCGGYISYEFRLLTDADKNSIAFNDGDLSFCLNLVDDEKTLHAVAQFRSMAELNEAEYRAAFSVAKQYDNLNRYGTHTMETLTEVLYCEWHRGELEDELEAQRQWELEGQ